MAKIEKRRHLAVFGEAFCLMKYREPVEGGRVEWIWNSRDGITPFCVLDPEQAGRSPREGEKPILWQHIDWKEDVCVPNWIPAVGSRVFANIPDYDPQRDGPHNVETVVVDEEMHDRFRQRAEWFPIVVSRRAGRVA
ncbi:hypothetical protein SAMN06297251_10169 [Fulvimarina manganoxydans]|uniref:Uncharacterized protein n=1 Tax=Fulvimarina manganoxydans TaxID=937218 RepID=A0A1W1Y942_9HYPH|nr:hypothetical protein [Fulvimarina manganoxydans]SMC32682.1 hypothetical protein SAMN06297251_10169 [Fulvimarina manganoxydans]